MPSRSTFRPFRVCSLIAEVIVAPTLLPILATEAIYVNERETGDRLHEISRILIGNVPSSLLCTVLDIRSQKGRKWRKLGTLGQPGRLARIE